MQEQCKTKHSFVGDELGNGATELLANIINTATLQALAWAASAACAMKSAY